MFVPCGGRPESIDLSTVSKLIKNGKSVIPYMVEGANLFITQDSKLRLEKAGCTLYKDASANKGGVTSSSLEVLASLSFDDQAFVENMCVREDGTVPEFYQAYVRQVQEVIKENATLEFEAIWREHEQSNVLRSVLSDRLSLAITKLDEELQKTELWENVQLRQSVLSDALPKLLLDKIGLETILQRVSLVTFSSLFISIWNIANRSRFRRITCGPSLAATWRVGLCMSTAAAQASSLSLICKSEPKDVKVHH